MRQEKGNALFLILIAVALFAALSYAITQSGRGGGGIDREQAEIAAAQIFNYAAAMKTAHQRLMVLGGVDQVQLTFEDEDPSGTCYSGVTGTTCTTIGLFSSETGLPAPDIEPFFDTSVSDNRKMVWISSRLRDSDGDDYGTSAPDTFVGYAAIRDEICEAINRKSTGSDTIPLSTPGSDASGTASNFVQLDNTTSPPAGDPFVTTASLSFEIPADNACMFFNGSNLYVTILDIN